MTTIKDIEEEIVEEFSLFESWTDKYDYLIDMGRNLPAMDDSYKTDDLLVRGCQSKVWLRAYMENGLVNYEADSDAMITKGIIALLIRVLSERKPEEILAADLSFIDRTGLQEHLSPTRGNGLVAMVKQMKYYALALSKAGESSF